jgi:microcin C transport system substrate-binding protein
MLKNLALILALLLSLTIPAHAQNHDHDHELDHDHSLEETLPADVRAKMDAEAKAKLSPQSGPTATPEKAVAMHGTVKFKDGLTPFDYTNPDAPKGGTLKLNDIGTFDSLNPFIIKGTPASGLIPLGQSFIYDSLMEQSTDEPFTMYGLLAESIERPKDNSWVAFNLRPEAKWADGVPVSANDVVWTFRQLINIGAPFYKAYYGDVKAVEATSEKRVRFIFSHNDNAELPLILSQLPILPKHHWEEEGKGRNLANTTLESPLGNGPYKIGKVVAGRSIEYVRDPNYWGKDLPINKGRFNFDRISVDYYKDTNVALEAFFAGEYDYRLENTAKLWHTAYNAPAVKDGRIIKEEVKHGRPAGMQGFIYNTRRPVFADKEVRKALAHAFDFEWSNKQFAYGEYTRTDSYFDNSELAAPAGPPTGAELKILEAYRGKIPDEVFTTRYAPPKNDGSGNMRENLRIAAKTLDDAGWKLGADGIRANAKGEKLKFEIIDSNPMFERWILPFIANLKKIGVQASFRVLDPAQYQNRMNDFDFDMTVLPIGQSDSPGNEQRDFWGSDKADIPGSRNYIGIKDKVVDELIEKLIRAKSREELVTLTQALDRVLLAGYYVIPQWHTDHFNLAYWKKLERPKTLSPLTPGVSDTWWARTK